MFNFGSSPPKSYVPAPASNAVAELRAKHISALRSSFPSLRLLSESRLEIPFSFANIHTQTATNLVLIVSLPPDFPLVAPLVSLKPPLTISHESIVLVDGETEENYIVVEAFEHWNQHVGLARVLGEVMSSLGAGAQQSSTSASRIVPPVIPEKPYGQANSPTNQIQSDQNEFMTSLESKSAEELEEMLADSRALEQHLVSSIPRISNAIKLREEIAKLNADIAEKTLAQQVSAFDARDKILAAQTEFAVTRDEFDQQCREYDASMMAFAPDYLLSRLRTALAESEELCDSVVSSMLRGELAVDDFLKRYRELRKVYHSRAICVEKGERDASVFQN